MHTYHVTYYYLATGMEGNADYADHGTIQAWSKEEAVEKMGLRLYPRTKEKYVREWGLSATRILIDTSRVKDI